MREGVLVPFAATCRALVHHEKAAPLDPRYFVRANDNNKLYIF